MNIQNHYFVNYTSSFVKENIHFSFSDSQKKITLVVLAIIGGLSLCFLLIRHIFRARPENQAPGLEKQKTSEKVKNLATEIDQGNNQNIQNQVQEEVIETKQEKIKFIPKEEQKLDHSQPKLETQKNDQTKDAPKPIPENAEPANKEPKPNPSLLGKIFPGLTKTNSTAEQSDLTPQKQILNPVQEKVEPVDKESKSNPLQQVPVPDLIIFTPAEEKVAEKIIKEIKEKSSNCCKVQSPLEFNLTVYSATQNVPQIIDKLVQQKLIHSWNTTARGGWVTVRVHKDDSLKEPPEYRWQEWRDLDVIEKEERFKKDNQIVIPVADTLLKSGLTDLEQRKLNELIDKLNQRVKPGLYRWSIESSMKLDHINKIGDFLLNQGLIVAFDQDGSYRVFKIAVKESDKLS